MNIENIVISNFKCFYETPISTTLDTDITCLVGNNGSGKTALIEALKRLFGTSKDDRTITRGDFYLAPNEDTDDLIGRKLFIEIFFTFPELNGDGEKAVEVCPAFSSVIYADDSDGLLKARMRLEALWDDTEYEDDVQTNLYWITTSDDVEFGEGKEYKFPVSPHDRKNIRLLYIPAFRDSKSTLVNEVKRLTKMLEGYTDVSPKHQEDIELIGQELSNEIQNLDAIQTATKVIKKIWNKAHDNSLIHYQEPRLESTPSELGVLLRSISVKLAPSEDGGCKDIDELSDGQISLLYFTLAIALYDIEQKHYSGNAKGFKELDKDIPVFTIFAFEEPENHLSPYYLGRIIDVLLSKTQKINATGIISSHSPSVVRRMDRVEQIRHFRQEVTSDTRYSLINKIFLPSDRREEDYKFINQAVLAHPELYFAKLVILGEGDSEEIVLPQFAEFFGIDLDPSFVSFVKLGGRHVNHMWRLLSDLNIPYITLLDLDLGRNGAGFQRVKYIIDELNKVGTEFSIPTEIANEDFEKGNLDYSEIKKLVKALEDYGIFYSTPLDLDMALIEAYPEAYDASKARKSSRKDLDKAVLGAHHDIEFYDDEGYEIYSEEELTKYRYLFCTKSKVASHYKAISEIFELEADDIIERCPDFIKHLLDKCSELLWGIEKDE